MTRRTLLTIAAAAGVLAGTGGVGPAQAEQRLLSVTLLGGEQATVSVDVPPGMPLEQVQIPGLTGPFASIQDLGPLPTPSATPGVVATPSLTATPTPTVVPTPTSTPRTIRGSSPQASTGTGSTRPKSRKRRANAQVGTGTVAPVATPRARRRSRSSTGTAGQVDTGRRTDGTPTQNNPQFTLATPGPAPIGVPNFFIDKFRIPPFLLPIYQAAGTQYGVRWEILAAINEIETDYGRNLNVSTAGAEGWMQFIPSSWELYGVDANRDGLKDPYNPVDAIFAAARYLRAAGADKDLRKAIFAYNHADWYVDSVLVRARLIGGLPANLVGSLTGLTQGRFPVYAKATYADDLSERELNRRVKKGQNAAYLVESDVSRRGINIYARRGAPVIAANDGRVVKIGRSARLGRYIQLQDVYGNTFTYARLGKIEKRYPAPRSQTTTSAQGEREPALAKADRTPSAPATAGARAAAKRKPARNRAAAGPEHLWDAYPLDQGSSSQASAAPSPPSSAPQSAAGQAIDAAKERLFANPMRPNAQAAGGAQQVLQSGGRVPGITTARGFSGLFGLDGKDVVLKTLRKGSRVAAGTVLGRIGGTRSRVASHVLFEIRPAGRGAPRIDPKPILDGWKLLESTAIYRASGRNPFFGRDAATPSVGQILLMSKEALAQRVAENPRIEIYGCGRRDIATGQVDRRVLATLEFLAASGLKPTVTSLRCGHSYLTASGNVSAHSSGNAVDIARINGISILGHQGKGSVTEMAIQRLLTLQGSMRPNQIISLMTFPGADNTLAMSDHDDHIHVGFQPLYGTNARLARQVDAALKPSQWIKLIDRLGRIDNPTVRTKPSKGAIKVKRASRAHRSE